MIPASTALHEAIRAGASQKTLLYFSGADRWFGSKDIVLQTVRYEDYFNSDEELTIGATPSASMSFSLVNDDNALSGFEYGWFTAYRGVQVDEDTYTPAGNCSIQFGNDFISGYDTTPYLRVGDNAYSYQPDFPVKGLFVVDDQLYAVGTNYKVFVVSSQGLTWGDLKSKSWKAVGKYTWGELLNGGSHTVTMEDEGLWSQLSRYITAGESVSITYDTTYTANLNMALYRDGTVRVYEFTPKGNFYADRPARTRTNAVEVEGHDAMYSVMEQMGDRVSITWPTTLMGCLNAVCAAAGVQHKVSTMLNGSMPVTQDSDVFQNITLREAVGLIAEASGAYAVFDYDGKLDLKWFTETSLEIDEHDYVTFVPYEYEVSPINKLQIRNSESDVGVLIGSGTNGYIIQENPFLLFDSASSGQTYGTPIYNRLSAFAEYTPASCDWFEDWTYQPGDVITVIYKEEEFRFPIFNSSESWDGLTRGVIECSGSETRPVLDEQARETYQVGKRMMEIQKTVDGLIIDLSSYTTESEVETMINIAAGEIEAELSNYVTTSGLTTTLTAYVTSSSLSTTLSSYVTGSGLSSTLEAYATVDSVSLTFKKIGASGYQATGITTITENGITVTHSSLSNYKTLMDASGFKILDSSNTVLGGIMTVGGSTVTAMSALYNPSYSHYWMGIGGLPGYANVPVYGQHFYRDTDIGGTIGLAVDNGNIYYLEILGDYSVLMHSKYNNVYLWAGTSAGIMMDQTRQGDAEITFCFEYNGAPEEFTAHQLWEVINIVLP